MRMLTKGISAVFILSVCGIALFAVEPSKHLTVKEVVITGNNKISPSEIVKRSGIRARSTSMLFSASKAEQKILENPWVSDARVKKFLHGKIKIEISENDPFCIVAREGTEPQYIDQQGKMLGVAKPSRGLDFPVISSREEISPDLMLQAIEILNLSKSSSVLDWSEISEIVVEETFGIKLLTLDRRFVIFGKNNMKNKWHKVERIIVHSRKKNLVEKDIDISSGEVGVIGYDS